MSYSRGVPIQVIKITVKCVAVELDSDYLLRGGVCNPERFLQAFKHPLTILVWELTKASVSSTAAKFLPTCRFDIF